MTIDEAIKHCLDVANSSCSACADEHRQLAEWLQELKQLRIKIFKDKSNLFFNLAYGYLISFALGFLLGNNFR